MKKLLLCSTSGFTIVDTLAAVAIIGTVAALSVTNYNQKLILSRQAQAKVLLGNAVLAQKSFAVSTGYLTACLNHIGAFPPPNSPGQYYSLGFSGAVNSFGTMDSMAYTTNTLDPSNTYGPNTYLVNFESAATLINRYNYSSNSVVSYNCAGANPAFGCDPFWGLNGENYDNYVWLNIPAGMTQGSGPGGGMSISDFGVGGQNPPNAALLNTYCDISSTSTDLVSPATAGVGMDITQIGAGSYGMSALGGIPAYNTNMVGEMIGTWAATPGKHIDMSFTINAVGNVDPNATGWEIWTIDQNAGVSMQTNKSIPPPRGQGG